MSALLCSKVIPNPFILAAGPPTASIEMIARGLEKGWGGAVTKSLLLDDEQTPNVRPRLHGLSKRGPNGRRRELYALHNIELGSEFSVDEWSRGIDKLSQDYPGRAIVANIVSVRGEKWRWQELAKRFQDAGSTALEVNVSAPNGGSAELPPSAVIAQSLDCTAKITEWVKEVATIPVMVKLSPNVSDIVAVGKVAENAGADAISAINTVRSIAGVDLESLVPRPSVDGKGAMGGLSGPAIKSIALYAVAMLAEQLKIPISGVGGISTIDDALEHIVLGASTVQLCTEVMLSGYGVIYELVTGLERYLERKSKSGLSEITGSALVNLTDVLSMNYVAGRVARIDRETCISCGECQIPCQDGGGQAIIKNPSVGMEVLTHKCVGCALCIQVCPVEGAITMVTKDE